MVLTSPERGSMSRSNSPPLTSTHLLQQNPDLSNNKDCIRLTLNTAAAAGTPSRSHLRPQRGTTLPHIYNNNIPATMQIEQRGHTARANTLPSTVQYGSPFKQELHNYINNNHHHSRTGSDHPMISRNAPTSVSILSLPTSDNEAQFNFANR